jgi:MoaA/NifB/PqqE/SkfB family radical SAM enzyme
VVTRENYQEIANTAMAARSLGVDNFRVSAMFNPEGSDYYSSAMLKETREQLATAAGLSSSTFQMIDCFEDRYADLAEGRPDYQQCGYQHFNTYIAGDLNVYRCCVTAYNPRGLVGSLQNQTFRQLWESQAKQQSYATFDARGCDRCMFNNKNRVINYATESSPADVDFV